METNLLPATETEPGNDTGLTGGPNQRIYTDGTRWSLDPRRLARVLAPLTDDEWDGD